MTIRDKVRRALLTLLEEDTPQTAPAAPAAAVNLQRAPLSTEASVPRRCASCRHFDHDAGQEALRQNPAMLVASQTIPPWAMGRKVERDEAGRLIPPAGTSKDWLKAKWSDLGACDVRDEGVFPFDGCDRYEAR